MKTKFTWKFSSTLARKWGHDIRKGRQLMKGVLLSQPYYGQLKLHAIGDPEETVWDGPPLWSGSWDFCIPSHHSSVERLHGGHLMPVLF